MLTIHIEQVLSQIIAFLLMFWILKKFAWGPLLNLMEERKKVIASEFEAIDQQKNELGQIKEEYHEKLRDIDEVARAKLQEHVERGEELAMKIQEKAHQEANQLINKAKEEIQNEIAKGKRQLKKEIVNMAVSISEKILDEKIDEKKQKELLSEFVKKAEME